jgi:hypothetical protein
MTLSLPIPTWQHGTDPEGSECWTLADPAQPGWQVVITWLRPRSTWTADYLPVGVGWWQMESPVDIHPVRSRDLRTLARAGTLYVYGHERFGEHVWQMMCDAGAVPSQTSTLTPAPEIRPPTG